MPALSLLWERLRRGVEGVLIGALLFALSGCQRPLSRPAGRWEVVRAGENLSLIARRCQRPLIDLIEANQLVLPDRIQSGQRLFCPGARPHRVPLKAPPLLTRGAPQSSPPLPASLRERLFNLRWPLQSPQVRRGFREEGSTPLWVELIPHSPREQIRVISPGEVSECVEEEQGLRLELTHGPRLRSRYAPLRACPPPGAQISGARGLGALSPEGDAGLRLELLIDGEPVNPLDYLPALPSPPGEGL